MNVKIYLDPTPDKQGRAQIFFYLVGSGTRVKLSSGIKVKPENWKNGLITSKEPYHDLNNSLLQAKLAGLNKLITELKIENQILTPEQIKKRFQERLQREQAQKTSDKHLLTDYMAFYRDQYTGIKKAGTIRAIKQVIDHISAFDPEACIEDINNDWLNKYCKYLLSKGLEDSTIKFRHIKEIKGTCNEAIRNGIKISPQVNQFSWESIDKQPFYATWEEVEAIEALDDFVHPQHGKIRDLFLLSCYTGLRNSDWSQINKQNIQYQAGQPMLRIQMTKTGFDYSIPITKKVQEILIRYNYQIPQFSQQEYNREIKNIARIAVKGQSVKTKYFAGRRSSTQVDRAKLFSSHTGRRTFGRRYLDKGGSLIILSKILGQKTIETTLRYLGYQPQEIVAEFKKVFG